MKKIFTTVLALSVGLASCNKSDDLIGPEEGATKIVTLKAENGVTTRALAASVDDEEVTFNDGMIYFVNMSGSITNWFVISTNPTTVKVPADAPLETGDNVSVAEMRTKEFTFKVQETAENIHVVGNTGISLPTSGNIADVFAIAATIQSQADVTGGVENVNLYGTGEIFEDSGLMGAAYKAVVDIKPIAARLELAKLTGEGDIEEYTLDGIFLNYFYTHAELNGAVNGQNFVAFTSLHNFEQGGANTAPWYSSANSGKLYDWRANGGIGKKTALVTTPNNEDVPEIKAWAYNVFAAEGEKYLPHMVLKFTGVKVTGKPEFENDKFYYITVKRYMDGNVQVKEFEGGYVYYIENLKFTEANLKEIPEWNDDIEVEVTFRIMDWTQQKVTAPLD